MTRPDDTTESAETHIDDTTDGRAERIAESVRAQLDAASSSRRGFLSRSAVAGGALLAIGSGTGLAQDDEEAEEAGAMFDDVRGTDVDVLNYALALEHLEAAFYEEALDELDEDDFVEADELAEYSEEARMEIYEYVEVVGEHESTHVDVLMQAVELLGGDPAPAMEYDFGVDDVGSFLEVGRALENTGVAAYAGAAPYVESPDLLGVALSIHSVEARHAAVFNLLGGESPFPDAFDETASQDEVLDAVSQFIEGEADDEADDEEDDEDDEEEADDEEDDEDGEDTADEEEDDADEEETADEEEDDADDEEDEETEAEDDAGDEGTDDAGDEGADTPDEDA